MDVVSQARHIVESSNGRTTDFGSVYSGSNPGSTAKSYSVYLLFNFSCIFLMKHTFTSRLSKEQFFEALELYGRDEKELWEDED
jgi:hypothetical protein